MKIGFDISMTHGQKSGCAWVAELFSRELIYSQSKHHIVLYDHFIDWVNEGLIGKDIDLPSHVKAPLRGFDRKSGINYWEKIKLSGGKEIDCDIVHSHNFQACKFSRSKLIYTLHDVSFWVYPEFATEVNRLACQKGVLNALKYADGILFTSEHSRKELHSILPGWNERRGIKECVIPLAPSHAANKASDLEASDFDYWLMVGSLEPRKNHAAALEALEIYWQKSSRQLPLKIAGGRGWKSDDLYARISLLEKQGKVEWLGYQLDEKMIELYRGATALLFPSWHEGFGLPVVEAMELGCPVIASNRASIPEVGTDALAYIDPSHPAEIAEQMLSIENDATVRKRMIANGQARARNFSWKKSTATLLDFYSEVLNTK